jgi:hypothetical protein
LQFQVQAPSHNSQGQSQYSIPAAAAPPNKNSESKDKLLAFLGLLGSM